MAYAALAQKFFFDRFEIDATQGTLRYYYRTDAGHAFTHELTLTFAEGVDVASLTSAIFALGMSELVHYWKAILAPEIVINAGQLRPEQVMFWETLYTKGLGEFFYKNTIDYRGLVSIVSGPDAPVIPVSTTSTSSFRALVPFGGGKDSLVTAELLKKQGKSFTWFELESLPFAKRLQEVSGVEDVVSIGRNVQKNFSPILELVKQGAPNGHAPITATYALSAVLASEIQGFSDIVLSLERSTDEGNVEYLGNVINHQYSKTFEFELALHDYVRRYINPSIRIFSLLRPFYEVEILEKFSQYPQYFPYFISCNRGLKTGTWCGECAKCAFMFLGLSAFLTPESVERIFTKNLFKDEKLIPLYEALVGLHPEKPFECVGTFEENLLAAYLAGEQYKTSNVELPVVLKSLPIERGKEYTPLLMSRGEEHLIPADYSV